VVLEKCILVSQQVTMNDSLHTAAHAKYTEVKATGKQTRGIAGIRCVAVDRKIRRFATGTANQKIGEGVHCQVTSSQTSKVEGIADVFIFVTSSKVMRSLVPGKLVRILNLVCGSERRIQSTADRECARETHDRRLRVRT